MPHPSYLSSLIAFVVRFLFVGGAILMTVSEFGKIVPILGAACAVVGVGMLIYFVFSKDGKY